MGTQSAPERSTPARRWLVSAAVVAVVSTVVYWGLTDATPLESLAYAAVFTGVYLVAKYVVVRWRARDQ